MSRRCELTGKGPQTGHKVSHSNIKTKRRFMVNLVDVTLMSDALERSVHLRISANALRSVDHRGGLDAFLLKAKNDTLGSKALKIKQAVVKKRAAAAPAAAIGCFGACAPPLPAGPLPAAARHAAAALDCPPWLRG